MTIKQHGGVFGRNPTFSNVTVDGTLAVDQIVEKTGAAGITLDGVTLKDGNVVLANGKGIDFSATAGTGTSELFDDYEEGTWTPVVTSSSGTLTTVTVTWATYTKVGNKVFVSTKFVLTDAGTGSGSLSIDGLPYTVASTGSGNAPVMGRTANTATLLHGQFAGNLARIFTVVKYDNTDPITNGYTYIFSGTYFA